MAAERGYLAWEELLAASATLGFKDSKLSEEIIKINDKLESKALNNELEEIKEELKKGKANKKGSSTVRQLFKQSRRSYFKKKYS